jgi:hypothetical protein
VSDFGKLSEWFTFVSDRFDQSSELPAEYNAGNRFYGKDVAVFLSEGLTARGFAADFLDEDWGWLVRARDPDDARLQIAVYSGRDGDSGKDEWALMVRQLEQRRRLGFLPWVTEREVDERVTAAIVAVFRDAGIELHRGSPEGEPL